MVWKVVDALHRWHRRWHPAPPRLCAAPFPDPVPSATAPAPLRAASSFPSQSCMPLVRPGPPARVRCCGACRSQRCPSPPAPHSGVEHQCAVPHGRGPQGTAHHRPVAAAGAVLPAHRVGARRPHRRRLRPHGALSGCPHRRGGGPSGGGARRGGEAVSQVPLQIDTL